MTVFPVVERELLVTSRHKGTYWGRFAAGAAGACVVAVLFHMLRGGDEKELGQWLIYSMSTVIFFYAIIAGVLSTCDCLSEEKREGTLGLLFLTDLTGFDVVLGKLVASSLNTFYGMMALVPMLAIPFILGGVDLAEMLRVVIVAFNLLLFSLGAGLFASAIARRDHWAMSLATIIALFLLVAGPVSTNFPPFSWFEFPMNTSPATGCFLAFADSYNSTTVNNHFAFWENVTFTQVYFWFFFIAACLIVPKSWKDAAFGKKSPRREKAVSRRQESRRELLDVNPYLWRVARGHNRWVMPGTLIVLFMIWLGACKLMRTEPTDDSMDMLFFIVAGLVLKLWMASAAARTFSEDRRGGGFELLLSTPIGERQIILGQLAALWRQFTLPLVGMVLMWGIFTIVSGHHVTDRANYYAWRLNWLFFFGADLAALGIDATWLGLASRKANRAAWLAFARIVLIPTAVWLLIFFLFQIGRANPENTASVALGLAIAIALVTDMFAAFRAAVLLKAQFRTLVAQGLERKTPPAAAPPPTPKLAEAT